MDQIRGREENTKSATEATPSSPRQQVGRTCPVLLRPALAVELISGPFGLVLEWGGLGKASGREANR